MNPNGWMVRPALATALVVVTFSAILAFTGLPYSETMLSTCPPCTSTQRVGSDPSPLLVVAIPLILGLASTIGLAVGRMFLAWSGAIPLLFFSILTGFSVGLLFLPVVVALIGLLAIIKSRQTSLSKDYGR
ncbi:MAG: hypothetical protein OK404_02000 [Thaumarchaeota archaeon]|nr:hypothetical protein [Nitrososphaerota archaeon]